jgi:hypothetical protein
VNKVVVDYIVVTSVIVTGLSVKVQLRLLNGWQPISGVSFDGAQYLQAMVKYKESEE